MHNTIVGHQQNGSFMDIEGIRTFLSIAQLGGFTRAAGQLHRSQPAISRRIGLMEHELGAPLLERVRGSARLTDAGRAFLPFAEAAARAIKDGRDAVRASLREESGEVSLALVGTLADTHIVAVLRNSRAARNLPRSTCARASSQEVSDLVRRGEVTLGLRYFGDDRGELSSRIIGEETMLVVCSPEHRLAGKRAGKSDLGGERWIGFPAVRGRESFGHILARRLMAAGLDETEVTTIDSLTAQKRLVEAGFGIALAPESSVRDELRLGSLRRSMRGPFRPRFPIAVIQRRRGHLNPAARALIALLCERSNRIGQKSRASDQPIEEERDSPGTIPAV
jgi:DNA-binding transcriptional LysR family regulator